MLVYVLSDLHISSPSEMPSWVTDKIKGGDLILVNGDITSQEVLDSICSSSKCYVVKGNCDSLDLPSVNVFEIDGVKCGQIHGDGISPRGDREKLYEIAKTMDVDILFTGHTHVFSVYEYKNKIFINPGSATGAPGVTSEKNIESIGEILFSETRMKVKIISKEKDLVDLTFSKNLFK